MQDEVKQVVTTADVNDYDVTFGGDDGEGAHGEVMTAAQVWAEAIISQTLTTPQQDVTKAGNWPADAKFGLTYRIHDTKFPTTTDTVNTVYFPRGEAVIDWLVKKLTWSRGCDYDFVVDYALYRWDWGPVFYRAEGLGHLTIERLRRDMSKDGVL